MNPALYLDHAATSPLRPEARVAWLRASELGANASSVHSMGRKSKMLLESTRETILDFTGAHNHRLVFTSSGTEANNLALRQADGPVLMGMGEHDSLYVAAHKLGLPVALLPLTAKGDLDTEALQDRLKQGCYVYVQYVNGETGIINNIKLIASLVKAKAGYLHVDAIQALGKMDIDFDAMGCDSMALSAHKIGGSQGVGALIYHRDLTLNSMIFGGGQEFGLRAGTENIAGIAAFAAALSASQSRDKPLYQAQAEAEAAFRALGVSIIGDQVPRVPGIVCLAQDDWSSSLQLIHLDMLGIGASSGSACSSGKVKPSRILEAMGLPELAPNVLRASSGWTTMPQDWQRFYDAWSSGYHTYMTRHAKLKEQV
jgi:cysteine desulfurase